MVSHRWLVIGIGNEYRSDDSVGLQIARKVAEMKLSPVVVKEESGEGAALMEAWRGFERVIVIDAVSSGSKPGSIFKFDASKERVPAKFFHYSTHAFSVAEAIELARTLHALPEELLLYGIEGEKFSAGTSLSAAVLSAETKVIELIAADLQSH
jgi:hydrogenase maturation protease